MTAPTVSVGIVGLGVGERHIAGFEADPRCRVVALCDIDPAKLAEVGARNPGRRLSVNPLDILTDPSIQVVSIASYDDAHRDQIVTALQHGKHVFVEKPLCLTRQELEDVAAALGRAPGLQLSSNLILRKAPRFVDLRREISEGLFGRLYYLEGDYNYGRINKITEGWRGRIPYYSVMHGGGIHMIDLLMWLARARPVEVMAMGNRVCTEGSAFRHDDLTVSLLRFEDGSVAKIAANFGCVHPHFHNLSVYGTAASFLQTHRGAFFYDSRDPAQPPREVGTDYPGAAKGDMIPAFVASILDGGEPEVTTQEVLDAMAVSLAVEQASVLAKPIKVEYIKATREPCS